MKLVNRGFLCIKPTKEFVKWVNTTLPDDLMDSDFVEANVYLIEEDFIEDEPIIESNFKKIFKNELFSVAEDESLWPEKLTRALFDSFFKVKIGTMVFDLEKEKLESEEI